MFDILKPDTNNECNEQNNKTYIEETFLYLRFGSVTTVRLWKLLNLFYMNFNRTFHSRIAFEYLMLVFFPVEKNWNDLQLRNSMLILYYVLAHVAYRISYLKKCFVYLFF